MVIHTDHAAKSTITLARLCNVKHREALGRSEPKGEDLRSLEFRVGKFVPKVHGNRIRAEVENFEISVRHFAADTKAGSSNPSDPSLRRDLMNQRFWNTGPLSSCF